MDLQRLINETHWMDLAIEEAKKAKARGDYCFGALVVDDKGWVVARGGNRAKITANSAKHVEVEVMNYAKGQTKERYLVGYTLVTTTEPCLMCSGVAYWLGIKRIVYGMTEQDLGEHAVQLGYRRCPVGMLALIDKFRLPFEVCQINRQGCLDALLEASPTLVESFENIKIPPTPTEDLGDGKE